MSTQRLTHDGDQPRLLHVHAHPDDESSKGAASTAMYASQGVEVLIATCTGGERGDILNEAMNRPEIAENLTEVRAAEMEAARQILGAEQVWLGFVDSGFPEGDPLPPLPEGCFAAQDVDEAAGRLVKVIREFRPHVVTTYDERGGYPHPDHIMTHRITMAALGAAADPQVWPEHGPAWDVPKAYYHMTFHRARLLALDTVMHEHGLESPYGEWLQHFTEENDMGHRVTTRVECADWFETRDDALRAHATQIDPDGRWFAVPLELQRKAYPTEDFELVRNRIDAPTPETDLFAGLAPVPRRR